MSYMFSNVEDLSCVLRVLPERRGRTLQSHQAQGFLSPWQHRADMLGMPHHCTSQGSSTCGVW